MIDLFLVDHYLKFVGCIYNKSNTCLAKFNKFTRLLHKINFDITFYFLASLNKVMLRIKKKGFKFLSKLN